MTLVLYRRRTFTRKVEVRRALGRAFDKAVRTKPPARRTRAPYANSNGGKVRCRGAPELCGEAETTTPVAQELAEAQNCR
jgi:hypothetical protein